MTITVSCHYCGQRVDLEKRFATVTIDGVERYFHWTACVERYIEQHPEAEQAEQKVAAWSLGDYYSLVERAGQP